MDVFVKAAAGVLITVVMYLVLAKRDKDFSTVLSLAVCCMVAGAAAVYLEPLITFVKQLQRMADLDMDILGILLKAVGIGMLAQIVELICADAGNAALGKTLQILASAVVLWLSLPLMSSLLELVERVLGGV